ncbi:hypothetical protein GCM10025857_34020 [Alicyclobacillus contaminans]|uniref:hypothetical protein n=1 Tax=Alicyclobacillus contaminans TaxID=392016 RepID=UPI0004037266|nr:hypothetical protein [Alicyclobacillus contaminans]GMA52045.1 hypothetical protein GCM10025857_34020 [Alicyclobacillus contaminans]
MTYHHIPKLAGVTEAAAILGWDRRKVATYWGRGKLPVPIQVLSATPVWTEEQIIRYAKEELGMTVFMVEKRIELFGDGEFGVTRVTCEPSEDGLVYSAQYHGWWTRPDGQRVRGEINAQFIEAVQADADAVLNAGWEPGLWTVEEVAE